MSRHVWVLTAIVIALIVAAATPGRSSSALAGNRTQAMAAKKVCKKVTKKVHGKKKKVKVCKTVKAAPTATPAPTDTPTPTSTPTQVPINVTIVTPTVQQLSIASFPTQTMKLGLPSTLRVDGPVTAMATADLNGDGNQDVVVLHAATNTLSVLMGNGRGGFNAPVDYPTGKGPASVTIGDVNGDGHPDLVVDNAGANSLGVYFNNGDGTFSAPASSLKDEARLGAAGQTLQVPFPANDPRFVVVDPAATFLFDETQVRAAVTTLGSAGQLGQPSVVDFSAYFKTIDGAGMASVGGTKYLDVLGTGTPGTTGTDVALFPLGELLNSDQIRRKIDAVPARPDSEPAQVAGGVQVDDLSTYTIVITPGGNADTGTLETHVDLVRDSDGNQYVALQEPGDHSWTLFSVPPSCAPANKVELKDISGDGVRDVILYSVGAPGRIQLCIAFGQNGSDGKLQGFLPWLVLSPELPGAQARTARSDRAGRSVQLPTLDSSPLAGAATANRSFLWFDSAGALLVAPLTAYAGQPLIVTAAGSTSAEIKGTIPSGVTIDGFDLAGQQFSGLSAAPSVTGLPGASVTLIQGGIHIGTAGPLPSTFDFQLTGLQPFVQGSTLPQMFGTDANGIDTVWFNASIES